MKPVPFVGPSGARPVQRADRFTQQRAELRPRPGGTAAVGPPGANLCAPTLVGEIKRGPQGFLAEQRGETAQGLLATLGGFQPVESARIGEAQQDAGSRPRRG